MLCMIPCNPKSKIPSVPWKEYQSKKYLGEIPPDHNYAVICGAISSDLVVIDIDEPELVNVIFKDFEGIKKNTLVVKTGSGGYHIYVKNKGGKIQTKRLDDKSKRHLDIQSEGCYVIGPGSIHPNGNRYEIISSTLKIDEMDVSLFVQSLAAFGFDVEGSGLPPVQQIARGAVAGNRNSSAFKYAAHLLGTLQLDEITSWTELLKWNRDRVKPPLAESELKLVLDSAIKKVGTKWIGKVIEDEVKKEEEVEAQKRIFKEISSKDERKIIEFQSLVVGLDDHRTVTLKSDVTCIKCNAIKEVVSTGFDNAEMPTCDECKIKMKEIENTRETIDVRTILLEELPEEITNNAPVRFAARVKAEEVKYVKINTRYNFKGRFTSMTNLNNKRINDITLQIFKAEVLEEPEGVCLTEKEIQEIREKIKEEGLSPIFNSIEPNLLGLYDVKESILIALAGSYRAPNRRGDINILISGNPSRGKSDLLKFIPKIVSKCDYVNGKSSSGVGLVQSMVKLPNGTSVVRAGKMVTNDGGFVCLDEIDKMKPADRGDLLEVMELQIATLNKSGANGIPVNARTAIIGACNPVEGIWNDGIGPLENLNLEQPFLSRFDKIWNLGKLKQIEQGKIADYVINSEDTAHIAFLDIPKFKHYLNTIRKLEPKISVEAGEKIKKFYLHMSEIISNSTEKIPMEVRQLHGLIRASIGRARCMLANEVTAKMVEKEIESYKKSLESLNLEVREDTIQMQITDEKINKETALIKAFKLCEDEDGLVKSEDFKQTLVKKFNNYYPDVYAAQKAWDKNAGSKFLLQPDGKWRISYN